MIQKLKLNKKQIIGVVSLMLATFLLIIFVYAESDVNVDVSDDEGGEFITFKLDHNVTTAKYKYFGYGYTVAVYSPDGKEIGYKYMDNSEFDSNSTLVNGVETVKIYSKDLFDKLDVAKEYYNVEGCYGRLNGRLGIKVNGVLTHLYDTLDGTPGIGLKEVLHGTTNKYEGRTVPLNKDDQGIREGLPHEYGGIRWTSATEKNLEQHFGIYFKFDKPPVELDQYEVQYKEIGTNKGIANEKKLSELKAETTITEKPVTANGYEYAGKYQIDKVDSKQVKTTGNITDGNSVTLNLKKTATRYIITFYYNKIDFSGGTGGGPESKPIYVDVYHREDGISGKEIASKETILTKTWGILNLGSKSVEDDKYKWICTGYFMEGKETEFSYETNVSTIINKFSYTTPVNDRLKVTFVYDKQELPKTPKCEPEAFGESEEINLTMKKKDFDNATEINVTGKFKLDEFRYGKDKDGNPAEGTHGFKCFDLYVKPTGGKEKTSFDNKSKTISVNFNVPKNNFIKQTEEKYRAYVDALYVGLCQCNNIGIDDNGISINITLEVNKPPVAKYEYFTLRKHADGTTSKVYDKAYVNQVTTLINQSYDPNGYQDMKYIKYVATFLDGKKYYAEGYTLPDGSYIPGENNMSGDKIEFLELDEEGNLDVILKTTEPCDMKLYVEDKEGLNDLYKNVITPIILVLKPTAVLRDEMAYRYPDYSTPFTGKQNRVVAVNSQASTVAEFLINTGVEINHTRDSLEIIALDGQDINTIKFSQNIDVFKDGNTVKIYYVPMKENFKIMFKQTGRYKVRLQVTDTNGNVSNWTEETFTIKEDIPPTATAILPEKEYRDALGNAEIKLTNISPYSTDGDTAIVESIKYKYDSNNNKKFDDETYLELKGKVLKTSNLGKYQFLITVKEKYGQETIEKYITDEDYKRGTITVYTEIDNISPNILEFKIMTTE